MTPLPGTKMIPTGWSRHHQDVVTGSMNATVTVTDPSRTTPGEWDPDTSTYGPPTTHVVRSGCPARIQQLTTDRVVDQAEQKIGIRRYLIQLPADTPTLQAGYRVVVETVESDPGLAPAGTVMTVTDVLHGSEGFTRDVIVEHNQQPEAA